MTQAILLLVFFLAAIPVCGSPTNDSTDRDAWVKEALTTGANLIDESASAAPLDRVRQQWIKNAFDRTDRIGVLRPQIEAGKNGKPIPPKVKAEAFLFAAYTGFLDPKFENILMKEDDKGLACHLWFNTKHGPVDVVYGYDTSGVLKVFRIDSLPKEVSVYMPAHKDGGDLVVLWFQDPDVSIVLSRTDPFAGYVLAD